MLTLEKNKKHYKYKTKCLLNYWVEKNMMWNIKIMWNDKKKKLGC